MTRTSSCATSRPIRLSDFRDLVSSQLQNVWDLSPAAGDPNGYTLTLRANAVAQIRETTMTQSIETIERRINALGLTEPTIQQRGGATNNEIIVELPGEGDPNRAKASFRPAGNSNCNWSKILHHILRKRPRLPHTAAFFLRAAKSWLAVTKAAPPRLPTR